MRGGGRVLFASIGLALACGAEETPPAPAPEAAAPAAPEAPPAPEEAPARGGAPSATAALRCPEGARVFERRIEAADTRLRWCERPGPDGRPVQEGPFERWLEGRIAESGSYQGGQRHGLWIAWGTGGEPQTEGAYDLGRRVGPWVFRDADGEILREVDYGTSEPVAVAEAEPDAAERGRSLRFENRGESEFRIELEPDAGDWTLAPGESLSLVLPRTGSDDLVIERDESGVRISPLELTPGANEP